MMKFNKEATRCQQEQDEKQHYNMVVGSKSLTINTVEKEVHFKNQGGIYYDN